MPFQDNMSVVVPRKLVEYVLPYAMPLPSSYSHTALVGSIIYQNEKIPIVDVSKLLKKTGHLVEESDGKRRIIIVSCINEHEEFNSYALIAKSAPRLLEVTESEMQETLDDVDSPFYSRIELDQIGEHLLMVLDLEALEELLFED